MIFGGGNFVRHHFSIAVTENYSLTTSTTWRTFFPSRQKVGNPHFAAHQIKDAK